ncbi:MAG: 3'-5' exonuclease, partial [Elusimicrobia bacterium]|nr:3'-5' exonuclease [Elusimicrobiota bacterium]
MPSSAKVLPGTPLAAVSFAFVDTETTGLSPRSGGRVCEVGIVVTKGGREVKRFQSLVNPDCPISCGAMMVHGITDEMVEQEPCFKELAGEVAECLQGSVFVAHNAPFDVGFLKAEFER